MKLNIFNKTRWDGKVIRSLVLRGLREHGIEDRCDVVIRYERKGSSICGLAAVGGRWMELRLPREQGDPLLVVKKLSSTIDHECLHLRGMRHRQFPAHARYCTTRGAPWHPEDCRGIVLIPEPAAPSLEEKRASKLAHARGMLAKATTRLKRAATIEARWRRRVKDLERRSGASPEALIEETLKLVAGSSS